jgi:hypothetical protein
MWATDLLFPCNLAVDVKLHFFEVVPTKISSNCILYFFPAGHAD